MRLPDHDRSILSTMTSLLRHYGAASAYPPLPELDAQLATRPKHVFFLALDGLGDVELRRALPEDAYLRRNVAARVTSVFPSTTAAAMTSYTSGLSPMEHGWLGWYLYMKEYAADVKTFLRSTYYTNQTVGGPYPANHLMPYETVLTQIRRAAPGVTTYTVYPPYESNTDRGANISLHAADFPQLCAHLRKIAANPGPTFAFAYWPQPDAAMHDSGVGSPEALAQYRSLDSALAALRRSLPDSLLVITSDHGLMNATNWIDVAQDEALLETLVMPPMLESRATAFYVKAHRRADFERVFRERYADQFLLLSREEVYASGIFGRGIPHRKFDDYIGDYIACATAGSVFAYSLPGREHARMVGYHAGLTEAEMDVAVILDRTE